jgi:hypothetical protein
MSIRVMTAVWDHAPYKGGTLLVLLAMADFASDDGGNVFPTAATLAKKARLEIRQVKTAIKTLREDGVLELVKETTGRPGQANEYKINVRRVQELHASAQAETGAVDDEDGCNPQQERVQSATGRVQSTASHIDNHQEPLSKPSSEPPAASPRASAPPGQSSLFTEQVPKDGSGYELPPWIPVEAWNGYVEMRKRIKAPLTDRAKKLEITELTKLRADGHDPEAVIDQSIRKSWRGLYPLKDQQQIGGQYGGRSNAPAGGATGSSSGRLDRIAQAASAAIAAGARSQ